MGFLTEDRMLFRHEWGILTYDEQLARARRAEMGEGSGSSSSRTVIDLSAAKKAHPSTKKTVPLYIGLTTGICGSFTSFSTFIRDVLLALSDNEFELPTIERSGGYSFLAMLAVINTTVCLTLSAFHIGAHLAIGTEKCIPSLSFCLVRKLFHRVVVILAWGSWLGVILNIHIATGHQLALEGLCACILSCGMSSQVVPLFVPQWKVFIVSFGNIPA